MGESGKKAGSAARLNLFQKVLFAELGVGQVFHNHKQQTTARSDKGLHRFAELLHIAFGEYFQVVVFGSPGSFGLGAPHLLAVAAADQCGYNRSLNTFAFLGNLGLKVEPPFDALLAVVTQGACSFQRGRLLEQKVLLLADVCACDFDPKLAQVFALSGERSNRHFQAFYLEAIDFGVVASEVGALNGRAAHGSPRKKEQTAPQPAW